MSVPTERVFWLVLKSAIKHKILIGVAFVSNSIAAMFEGATLVLFAISISIITGDKGGAFVGKIEYWLERLLGISLEGNERDIIFFILIALAIVAQLVKVGFHLSGVAASIYLRTYALGDIQSKMVRQVLSFSLSQVNKYPGGELSAYVGMAGSITSFVLTLNGVISKLLMVISYLLVMFSISIYLTPTSIVISGILMLLLSTIFVRLKKYGRQVTRAGVRLGKEVMEFLYAPKFIRTYGKEQEVGDQVIEQIQKGLNARRKGVLLRAIIQPIFDSVAILLAGILLIGGYFIIPDTETTSRLPTLLAFVIVFRRLMSALSELNGDRATIASLMPSAEAVAEVLRTDNKEFTRIDGISMQPMKSEIRLENLGFSYQGANLVTLSDIDLVIPCGQVIGIVGESGSGKTTLIDVILGLYPPDSGDICMDGISVSQGLPESWRRQFGVVSQDSVIFNKSIKENLAMVNFEASDQEIINACQVANAHDFICEQADGYDTILGDRGHKLSGGQIQRLALARAILSNATILVLDEATSALDSISEQRVIDAVNRLQAKHTIIQIAHRLSTVMHADQIIVMKAGRVIEQGRHDALILKGGEYAQMWFVQSSSNIQERKSHSV